MKIQLRPLAIALPPIISVAIYFTALCVYYQGMGGKMEQIMSAATFSALFFYPVGLLILIGGIASIKLIKQPSLPLALIFVIGGTFAPTPLLLLGGSSTIQSYGFIALCTVISSLMYPAFIKLNKPSVSV